MLYHTSNDPTLSAQALDDELLSACIVQTYGLTDGLQAQWARHTRDNYEWAMGYLLALNTEYEYRFDKVHDLKVNCLKLWANKDLIPKGSGLEPFVNTTEYKDTPVIEAYRQAIRDRLKNVPTKFTKRTPPLWSFTSGVTRTT